MKKLLTVCVLLMALSSVNAQKVYFIYIQSDSNVPFFVKLNDQVTSSNPSGYLILPKLLDSVYQFTIGKTGQAGREAKFSVTINKKDHGYLLREADEKFNLFDLQSMTSLQPIAARTTGNGSFSKRTDAFSVLLAQAANDPTLLDVHTATAAAQMETAKKPEATPAVVITTKEPEKETSVPQPNPTDMATTTDVTNIPATDVATATPEKKETAPEITKPDTAQQTTAASEAQPQNTATEETMPYKRSTVIRKAESSTSEGFGLTFLDKTEDVVDTIRILIPNQTIVAEKSDDGDLKKFLNSTNVDSAKTAKTDTTVAAANEKLRAAEQKKQRKVCIAEAGEKDFFKLRKNMAAKSSEEAMLDEARKAFKKNCFSTEQIKNLSALFLTASGKYHFFDAAYGHVSNQEQYGTLQTELDDAYYANRFKALIANQ